MRNKEWRVASAIGDRLVSTSERLDASQDDARRSLVAGFKAIKGNVPITPGFTGYTLVQIVNGNIIWWYEYANLDELVDGVTNG